MCLAFSGFSRYRRPRTSDHTISDGLDVRAGGRDADAGVQYSQLRHTTRCQRPDLHGHHRRLRGSDGPWL
jgi:hypothetical protein